MKSIEYLAIAAVLLVGLYSAGCTVLPKPEARVVERYTLETPWIAATPSEGRAAQAPVLLIPRPLARADLDTPRMAYRQQEFTLRYFANNRWADSPPQLLLPGLIEAFDASGEFAAVIRPGSPAVPRLRLDTEILEFSQDFRTDPSTFNLRLRAQLLDLETRQVIASRVFAAQGEAPQESPFGGAQAANAAWRALLPQLVDFVAAQLPLAAP